ncbi:hypothetical protein BD311DRAFT_826392 [Dichomitus squalens]|uniref:Transmembrane protein n=1 Tax=Dichomitus squalens TaxID=114155 RepID=A0A4Q9MW86_9APHY|nr:hypothetical protein BD311DRAFT_826392 [Dichomitus squalens]
MALTQDNGGTRLTSTRYVHYGTVTARCAGINTSAQGMSEWVDGLINWSDPDYQSTGLFYAFVNKNTSAFPLIVAVTNGTTVNCVAGADRVVAAGAGGGVSLGFGTPDCSRPVNDHTGERLSTELVVRLWREWFQSLVYLQSFYVCTLMVMDVPKKLRASGRSSIASVFTVIGLVVLFIAIVTNAVCRHRAKKLDRKIAEAAADAYPVESVSIVCADAKSNPANAQLHMYGKNTSAVLVTNETTVNGAVGADGVAAASAGSEASLGLERSGRR